MRNPLAATNPQVAYSPNDPRFNILSGLGPSVTPIPSLAPSEPTKDEEDDKPKRPNATGKTIWDAFTQLPAVEKTIDTYKKIEKELMEKDIPLALQRQTANGSIIIDKERHRKENSVQEPIEDLFPPDVLNEAQKDRNVFDWIDDPQNDPEIIRTITNPAISDIKALDKTNARAIEHHQNNLEKARLIEQAMEIDLDDPANIPAFIEKSYNNYFSTDGISVPATSNISQKIYDRSKAALNQLALDYASEEFITEEDWLPYVPQDKELNDHLDYWRSTHSGVSALTQYIYPESVGRNPITGKRVHTLRQALIEAEVARAEINKRDKVVAQVRARKEKKAKLVAEILYKSSQEVMDEDGDMPGALRFVWDETLDQIATQEYINTHDGKEDKDFIKDSYAVADRIITACDAKCRALRATQQLGVEGGLRSLDSLMQFSKEAYDAFQKSYKKVVLMSQESRANEDDRIRLMQISLTQKPTTKGKTEREYLQASLEYEANKVMMFEHVRNLLNNAGYKLDQPRNDSGPPSPASIVPINPEAENMLPLELNQALQNYIGDLKKAGAIKEDLSLVQAIEAANFNANRFGERVQIVVGNINYMNSPEGAYQTHVLAMAQKYIDPNLRKYSDVMSTVRDVAYDTTGKYSIGTKNSVMRTYLMAHKSGAKKLRQESVKESVANRIASIRRPTSDDDGVNRNAANSIHALYNDPLQSLMDNGAVHPEYIDFIEESYIGQLKDIKEIIRQNTQEEGKESQNETQLEVLARQIVSIDPSGGKLIINWNSMNQEYLPLAVKYSLDLLDKNPTSDEPTWLKSLSKYLDDSLTSLNGYENIDLNSEASIKAMQKQFRGLVLLRSMYHDVNAGDQEKLTKALNIDTGEKLALELWQGFLETNPGDSFWDNLSLQIKNTPEMQSAFLEDAQSLSGLIVDILTDSFAKLEQESTQDNTGPAQTLFGSRQYRSKLLDFNLRSYKTSKEYLSEKTNGKDNREAIRKNMQILFPSTDFDNMQKTFKQLRENYAFALPEKTLEEFEYQEAYEEGVYAIMSTLLEDPKSRDLFNVLLDSANARNVELAIPQALSVIKWDSKTRGYTASALDVNNRVLYSTRTVGDNFIRHVASKPNNNGETFETRMASAISSSPIPTKAYRPEGIRHSPNSQIALMLKDSFNISEEKNTNNNFWSGVYNSKTFPEITDKDGWNKRINSIIESVVEDYGNYAYANKQQHNNPAFIDLYSEVMYRLLTPVNAETPREGNIAGINLETLKPREFTQGGVTIRLYGNQAEGSGPRITVQLPNQGSGDFTIQWNIKTGIGLQGLDRVIPMVLKRDLYPTTPQTVISPFLDQVITPRQ